LFSYILSSISFYGLVICFPAYQQAFYYLLLHKVTFIYGYLQFYSDIFPLPFVKSDNYCKEVRKVLQRSSQSSAEKLAKFCREVGEVD